MENKKLTKYSSFADLKKSYNSEAPKVQVKKETEDFMKELQKSKEEQKDNVKLK